MADTADIVVVGGGVRGASTAWHLAKRGAGKQDDTLSGRVPQRALVSSQVDIGGWKGDFTLT